MQFEHEESTRLGYCFAIDIVSANHDGIVSRRRSRAQHRGIREDQFSWGMELGNNEHLNDGNDGRGRGHVRRLLPVGQRADSGRRLHGGWWSNGLGGLLGETH
jgi:hypothetical protein